MFENPPALLERGQVAHRNAQRAHVPLACRASRQPVSIRKLVQVIAHPARRDSQPSRGALDRHRTGGLIQSLDKFGNAHVKIKLRPVHCREKTEQKARQLRNRPHSRDQPKVKIFPLPLSLTAPARDHVPALDCARRVSRPRFDRPA